MDDNFVAVAIFKSGVEIYGFQQKLGPIMEV